MLKIVKHNPYDFGHIHSICNIYEENITLFINASVLNKQYYYKYNPITFNFDFDIKS